MTTNATNAILAQQVSLERWTNVIANDLANVNTDGYEGKNAQFGEFSVYMNGEEASNMVENHSTYRKTNVGAIEHTNNDFDFALASREDFYAIQTNEGVRYTRKSHFILDDIIKDDMGNALLSQDGGEIAIPAGTLISVTPKGRITDQTGEFIAQLQIVNFGTDTQLLREEAGSYYNAGTMQPEPSPNPMVQHKHVLNSNVSMHESMRDMMLASKLYQQGNNLLKIEAEQQQASISLLQ